MGVAHIELYLDTTLLAHDILLPGSAFLPFSKVVSDWRRTRASRTLQLNWGRDKAGKTPLATRLICPPLAHPAHLAQYVHARAHSMPTCKTLQSSAARLHSQSHKPATAPEEACVAQAKHARQGEHPGRKEGGASHPGHSLLPMAARAIAPGVCARASSSPFRPRMRACIDTLRCKHAP